MEENRPTHKALQLDILVVLVQVLVCTPCGIIETVGCMHTPCNCFVLQREIKETIIFENLVNQNLKINFVQ